MTPVLTIAIETLRCPAGTSTSLVCRRGRAMLVSTVLMPASMAALAWFRVVGDARLPFCYGYAGCLAGEKGQR